MRTLASCFAILALGGPAVASDVQPGDQIAAIYDGIACFDWTSFEAFQDSDPKTLKKLHGECLVIHGAPPTLFIVDAVKESAAAVCILGCWGIRLSRGSKLGLLIGRLGSGNRLLNFFLEVSDIETSTSLHWWITGT